MSKAKNLNSTEIFQSMLCISCRNGVLYYWDSVSGMEFKREVIIHKNRVDILEIQQGKVKEKLKNT